MGGETAMRNPPVVVSRGGEGEGLPLPGRSLLENGRGGGGVRRRAAGQSLLHSMATFLAYLYFSMLFYAFLCFLAAGKAASR